MTKGKGILPPRGASLSEALEHKGWTVTDTGCWEWKGRVLRQGYGQISYGGKDLRVNRAAYIAWVGPIGDMHVLHTCDNRLCINPAHLFLGTNADNIADKVAKGRAGRMAGERNPYATLTASKALSIYTAINIDKRLLREVAAEYGVSISCVHSVATGKSWRTVTNAGNVPVAEGRPR